MATRNRYAELMAQYQEAQPFSFTGYPSTYTGGYDVSQPQAYAAPMNRYADIMAQSATTGPSGRPIDYSSVWTNMTPAERAAYYAANPTEGKLALGAQDAIGWTSFGGLSKLTGPDAWYNSRLEKMGVNPTISLDTQNSLGGFSMQKALDSQAQSQANAAAAAASAAADAQAAEQGDTSNYSNEGRNSGGGGGGGYSGAPSGGSDVGRSAPGSAHYAQGGHVSMQHLLGPDPEGPDDGYGALKDGEYVINDKAVKKYGIELMQAINSGKISKGKLRGLLEM